MNAVSKIILSAVIIAVFACLWFLLTQKNKNGSGFGCGGCGGGCAGCAKSCADRKDNNQPKN